MNKEYYLLDGDERTGPFSYRELVQQGMDVNTQLSTPFDEKWQYASEIPDFFDYFKSIGIHFPTGDNLAGFWIRAGAMIIDLFILIVPLEFIFIKAGMLVVPDSIEHLTMPSQTDALIMQASFLLTFLLYNSLAEISTWKGSIGKKVCNLMVVDINGTSAGFLRVFGRNLGAFLSLNFLYGIPFLSMLFNEYRQNWYDSLAKTYVVKTN